MHSKLLVFIFIAAIVLSVPSVGQVAPAAEDSRANFSVGGGIDYWQGDWGGVNRFGPSAWFSTEIWKGIGVNLEGHSMIVGGGPPSPSYKYWVGEGGVMYTNHHFHNFSPYVKGEMGFASLSFPHKTTSTYGHDTRTTWAVGGGFEYKLWKHLWTRVDYTYDGFPDFLSQVTLQHHTLNPNGFAVGPTYHFR
jgi:opacity protein-like surface antigen